MIDEAARFEMEGELGGRVIASLELRHELRGEEPAQELDVP